MVYLVATYLVGFTLGYYCKVFNKYIVIYQYSMCHIPVPEFCCKVKYRLLQVMIVIIRFADNILHLSLLCSASLCVPTLISNAQVLPTFGAL